MLRSLFAVATATVVALSTVPAADAAVRYASPTGNGPVASCPKSNPCSLQSAVENVAVVDGDQVIVNAGTYTSNNSLEVLDAIDIGGAPGDVPFLKSGTSGAAAVRVAEPGAVVHDLRINQTSPGGGYAILVNRGTAERINAKSAGLSACGVGTSSNLQSLLRDSVCWSAKVAPGGRAVSIGHSSAFPFKGKLRNVTAWGTGPNSVGIFASASGDADLMLDARNVIAHGVGDDVEANTDLMSTATLTFANSNYGQVYSGPFGSVTSPGSGTNQTAAPVLADPANGQFFQSASSPTVDAGSVGTLLGSLDVGGDLRIDGAQPDIGADELDRVTPATTIESGPSGPTSNDRPSFAFSASEPRVDFACSVDSSPFEGCSSPFVTESLDDGPHTFAVYAADQTGNVESSDAERSFTVDTILRGAKLKAKRSQRQRGGKIVLKVSARAAETVDVNPSGKIKAGKQRISVVAPETTLADGVKRTLKLKPTQKRSSKKLLKWLQRGRKASARIGATFVDAAGNEAAGSKVSVRLTAK